MNSSTNNATDLLISYLMNITEPERRLISLYSECQYTQCEFLSYDEPDFKSSCVVKPVASSESNNTLSNTMLIAKHIRLYVYPIFIFVGILGNKLSCFIMFANARRSGYPSSLFLTLLAFVDCLYLIASPLPEWISYKYKKRDLRLVSNTLCRLVYLFGNFTTHLSAGLVVGVTIERFIAVQYPLIAHKINNIMYTRIFLCVLIIFFLLLDSPVLMIVRHINQQIYVFQTCNSNLTGLFGRDDLLRCDVTAKNHGKTWVYLDLAAYTLIPFIVIITLNSLIIRRLIEAQRFRRRMFRFSNASLRSSQQDSKHRYYSESYQTIELMGISQQQQQQQQQQVGRYRRFQSIAETKPLVISLNKKSSLSEERRLRYNAKPSNTSSEVSIISLETKGRSRCAYEMSSTRHKSLNDSNSDHTRLTILLLFVSCSFLVLTLPAVVVNLIMTIKSQTSSSPTLNNYNSYSLTMGNTLDDENLPYTLARLSMITNHSINFILYFVVGKRFRRDLKQLLVGYWKKLYR